MLPEWFVSIAIAIRIIGGLSYFHGVFKGRAKPNPITWFIWSATAMVAFAAQLDEHIGVQAWVTFSLGVTPLLVCIVSLFKNRSEPHFTPFNMSCGVLAIIGIILWQVTDNALLAIVFSIFADTAGSIPTVIKAFKNPASEYAPAYSMSILSMIVTLLTVDSGNLPVMPFRPTSPSLTSLFWVLFCGEHIAPNVNDQCERNAPKDCFVMIRARFKKTYIIRRYYATKHASRIPVTNLIRTA